MLNRARLMRLFGVFTLFFALITGNLSVCANAEAPPKTPAPVKDTAKTQEPISFEPDTPVQMFDPSTDQWPLTTFKQLKPRNEFTFIYYLYRVMGSGKALLVPGIDISKLIEADKPLNKTFYRRPTATDVVQVLDKDLKFVSHEVLGTVPSGTKVRFQGRVYEIAPDRSLLEPETDRSVEANRTSQRIKITQKALQHIIDRHTPGGKDSAGKSIFNSVAIIETLIRNAESVAPVLQQNGRFQRVVNADRNIGYDRRTKKQTSTYSVITTQSEELITAFPGMP